MELCLK